MMLPNSCRRSRPVGCVRCAWHTSPQRPQCLSDPTGTHGSVPLDTPKRYVVSCTHDRSKSCSRRHEVRHHASFVVAWSHESMRRDQGKLPGILRQRHASFGLSQPLSQPMFIQARLCGCKLFTWTELPSSSDVLWLGLCEIKPGG